MSSADRGTIGRLVNWLQTWPRQYGFVLVSVAAAALVRYSLDVTLGYTQPFVLFYPFLVLIALLGGFGPAVFATLLSAAIADYLFLEPINSLAVRSARDIVGLTLFAAMGVTISWVGDWFRRRAMRLQEFERAVDGMEEMIVVVDRDYRCVIANRAFLSSRGIRRDDLIGCPIQEIVNPEVFETTVKGRLEECFRGKIVHYETRYRYPQRGERDVSISHFPVVGPGGVDRIVSVWRDVTDKKEAELALKLFRALIDQSNDAVWVVDPETLRFLDVNEKACRDLRYPREELLARSVPDIDRSLDPSSHAAVTEQLRGSGFVVKETVHQRKDGSTFPVEISLKSVELDRSYIVVVSRDISERKQSEEALRESQQRFSGIIASAMDAIITVDEQQRIILFNAAAEKMFRCREADALGQPIERFIPQRFRAAHFDHFRKFEATGVTKRTMAALGALSAVRADGQEFQIEASISKVESGGKRLFTVILRDITERKQAEEELRQGEERFRLFIEHAPAALAMFDREMRYLHVSRRWRTDYGLGDRDLRGVSHYEVFPGIPERWKVAHRNGLAGRILREEDDRFDRADGSVRWIRWEIRPWHDATGGIGGIVIFTEDVTERRMAEQLLRESEENYRTLFNSMAEGFCTIEMQFNEDNEPVDYRFLEVNPAFERLTGIQNGRGKTMREIAPQHEQHWFATYGKVALTGTPARFENLAAQLHRWYDVHAFRVGEPHERRVAIFFDDITSRKQSEDRLREYERVVENVEDMIAVVDSKYRYVIVNRSFLCCRDMEREQVIGRRVDEVLNREIFESVVKSKMDECFTGKVVQYEMKYKCAGRGERELTVSHFPIEGPNGIDRIGFVLQDFTERNRAEDELRKSEERFSKAFRSSPLAITISSQNDERYMDVNEAYLQMTHHERRDVIGRTASELGFWVDTSRRDEMFRQLRESGRVTGLRSQFESAAGEVREAEVSAEIVDLEGQPCILAITRDITDTLRLEAQFRQAQKMEAVGRLAGGVAHDFNNLLGVITGYSDLSLGVIEAGSPARRHLEQIKKASYRAVSMTRQLLAFSRQQVVFPKLLDLNDLVNSVTTMLRRLVGEDVEISFRPTTPLGTINADPGQIEQVLMNLVVNARDAMPGGGSIIIETAQAQLDEHFISQHPGCRIGEYIVLLVSDTGCGMDEYTKSRLFEPFFTTKEVGRGTGLGLSTVYGIVKQGGGTVFVYSEPGKGTTFKIYLPRVIGKAEQLAQSPDETESQGGSETILVVEDDAALRDVTIRLLQTAGYQVLEATGADAALELVRASKPGIDLLLTDVIMPGKTGVQLVEEAKLFCPTIRSLLMSGYAGDLVALRSGWMPEASFLEKPFTRSSLLRKIRSAFEDRSQLEESSRGSTS